ncbi:MAG: hypothetical protein JXA52_07905 [Planctomycetes bacterium]|nr:hypothetical protein [Planctomycetota bacterium]
MVIGFLIFLSTAKAADVGVVGRKDIIHLKDGTTVEGSILLSGPKGTTIITMKGGRLEQFFPAEKIARIEQDVSTDDKQKTGSVQAEEKIVNHYQAEPLEGKLEVIDIGKTTPSDQEPEEWEDEKKVDKEDKEKDLDKEKKSVKRGLKPIFKPKTIYGDDKDKAKEKEKDKDKEKEDNLFGQDDK